MTSSLNDKRPMTAQDVATNSADKIVLSVAQDFKGALSVVRRSDQYADMLDRAGSDVARMRELIARQDADNQALRAQLAAAQLKLTRKKTNLVVVLDFSGSQFGPKHVASVEAIEDLYAKNKNLELYLLSDRRLKKVDLSDPDAFNRLKYGGIGQGMDIYPIADLIQDLGARGGRHHIVGLTDGDLLPGGGRIALALHANKNVNLDFVCVGGSHTDTATRFKSGLAYEWLLERITPTAAVSDVLAAAPDKAAVLEKIGILTAQRKLGSLDDKFNAQSDKRKKAPKPAAKILKQG